MPSRSALVAFTVVILGAAAVGGMILSLNAASPVEPTATSEPILVPVREQRADSSFTLTLESVFTPGRIVYSTSSGLVTTVAAAPGQTLKQGDPVLGIGQRLRPALVSPEPLARTLSVGDEGEDVLWIQQLLEDVGYLAPGAIDGVFGRTTRAAVAEFNEDLGWPAANRNTFFSDRVVWIGPDQIVVGTVLVQAGQLVSAGQPLIVGPANLTAFAVNEPVDAPIPSDVPWEIIIENRRYHYDRSRTVLDDPALLDESSDIAMSIGEEGLVARAVLANPPTVQLIPASAVVLALDGIRCVYVPDGSGGFDSLPITVGGGDLGVVILDQPIPAKEVLANPVTIERRSICD